MLDLNLKKPKLLEPTPIPSPTPSLKSKLSFMIPVFIAALITGFLIELLLFERISLSKLSETLRDNYLLSQSQYESEESVYNMAQQFNGNRNKNKVVPLTRKDDHTLLDIGNFSFLINNQSICNQGVEENNNSNILLILVASRRHHFMERKVIRETYGSLLKIEDFIIRVVFLIGIKAKAHIDANPFGVSNETLNSLLEKEKFLIMEENELVNNESSLYGDMVVGNYIENQSFHNSYRHIMGYKWVLNFCHNARYVFNVDDNIFVNLYKLLAQNEFSFDTDFFCKILYLSPANCVLCLDNLNTYPKFCAGRFYGVSVEWIHKIYSVSQKYRISETDDGFVTGILREIAERYFNANATISEKLKIGFYNGNKKNLCSESNFNNRTEITQSVIYLPRKRNMTEHFMCLWNTTLIQ